MANSPPDHDKPFMPMVHSPPSFQFQRKGSLPSSRKSQGFNGRSNSDHSQTQPLPFIPSRITHVHSQQSPRSLSTDDGYQGHTMMAKPFTTQHDPKRLLNVVTSVVKTRSGSVLSRSTILKMDHFPSGAHSNLDFHLQGAPNFRMVDLNVYGVAQPTVIGLSTILALLNCHPKSHVKAQCSWFSTREEPLVYLNGTPYVLREYTKPLQNIRAYYGMNSERLEKMEERLKADVVKETAKFGGLVLVHQELMDGTVVPCWLSADSIQTPKEVFQKFQEQNYRLQYFRIPICPDQSPGDNYLDEYVRIIKTLDPTDPLIFNCGMGVVRTTVGMIVAQIIRRTQLIERGIPDPFPIIGWHYNHAIDGEMEVAGPMAPELVRGLEEAAEKNNQTKALLRLVYVLEKGLDSKMSPHSAIEWALARGQSIDALRQAIMGNYLSIVALSSALESGSYSKKLLDEVIDRSDAIVNLREDILMNRIRQTTVSSNQQEYDPNNNEYLAKALAGLERYFFLLIFTAYINESQDTRFTMRFSDWVKGRSEIWSMMQKLRRKGPQLYLFRPVEDLSALGNGRDNRSRGSSFSSYGHGTGMFGMTDQTENRVAGEVEGYALKARSGSVLTSHTILKVDFWQSQWVPQEEQPSGLFSPLPSPNVQHDGFIDRHSLVSEYDEFLIEGASNFRRISHTSVHAVAQPTIDGLKNVLRKLRRDRGRGDSILWINLREEPIIYINGIPYVLRDRYFTLRNIRAYSGITSSRLEMLEQRLKEDVINETINYEGRILLHGEDKDGNVRAVWEDVHVDDILTVKDIMEQVAAEVSNDSDAESVPENEKAIQLAYYRVPVTAEKPPEWKDFDDMRNLIASTDHPDANIVLNCQVGLGRSTTGAVIATLLTSWIYPGASSLKVEPERENAKRPRHNYQLINSLLRVIKNGLEVKSTVDDAIDRCGQYLNLRGVIEDMHVQAENETEEAKKKRTIKKGITALERYFLLICFQSYLDQTSPEAMDDTETFERWMKRHPELSTILLDTRKDDIDLIVPVENSIGDGLALESEVMGVVSSRHGQVLAQQTILKHDAFPGCQKMSLREKVDGAPNYRRVEAKGIKAAVKFSNLQANTSGLQSDMERDDFSTMTPPYICGCAMPTKDAIKKVLAKMDAGPGGKRKVLWTCLREEPVLYVNKRPYVLRLFQDPLKNLETTGIAKERVEGMENRMKSDVLEELKVYDGRLLLHDEETTDKGGFIIVPQWETVPVECVETPGDVFKSIVEEGYMVDYLRIPITDEQAPIPDVFDQLIRRMQDANTGVDVLFNCQMGRGRTTTGMVTACLMTMILKNDLVMDMTNSYVVEASNTPSASTADLGELSLYNLDEDEAHQATERYRNGEYKIILQLVSALTYGKLAKRLTDHAINECDHMQNLRKAIYDYKLRLDALELGSQKYHATHEVGLNYLVRYFYLIVFANYLLEEMVSHEDGWSSDGNQDAVEETTVEESILDDEAKKIVTFSKWLKGRREITNIIKLNPIDFE